LDVLAFKEEVMKQWLLAAVVASVGIALVVPEADAKRAGGSRSSGAQRSVTSTPPASAPAKPGQTSQMNQAQPAAPAAAPAGATPQPASGLARWAPMLGGLAIGGLLGSMFAGGLGNIGGVIMAALLFGLLAFGAVFLFRMFAQKRGAPLQRPLQYAAEGPRAPYPAMGNETVAAPPPSQMSGFDRGDAAPVAAANVPAGFDVAGFVRGAKMNFIKVQVANDAGNVDELREFTTPEMFEELKKDLAERGGASQQTDVVALNADLLEVVTEGSLHWASIRFSGTIRETPSQAPEAFEEVWSLSKPVDGSTGWVLAGIQQMH
jgi:predicted lipid-binding transport protein (Tim44 family)